MAHVLVVVLLAMLLSVALSLELTGSITSYQKTKKAKAKDIMFEMIPGREEYTAKHRDIPAEKTIVMAMMLKNDLSQLQKNLLHWVTYVKYFIFLVDTTADGTAAAYVEHALGSTIGKEYYTIKHSAFLDFDNSRSLLLQYTDEYYSHAKYVLMADPDWGIGANPKDISLNDLHTDDSTLTFFSFNILNSRNKFTGKKYSLWQNIPGIKMKYKIHETVDLDSLLAQPQYHSASVQIVSLNWTVYDNEERHHYYYGVIDKEFNGKQYYGQDYIFDLLLLKLDEKQYPDDAHTHYYIGMTNFYLLQSIVAFLSDPSKLRMLQISGYEGIVLQREEALVNAIKYLEFRARKCYVSDSTDGVARYTVQLGVDPVEQRWNAMYTLGHIYAAYLNKVDAAQFWYDSCYELNPFQTDSIISWSRLYSNADIKESISILYKALVADEHTYSSRAAMKAKYLYAKQYTGNCEFHIFAMQILSNAAVFLSTVSKEREMSIEEVKYILLLGRMAIEQCPTDVTIIQAFSARTLGDSIRASMNTVLKSENIDLDKLYTIPSTPLLCNDSRLVDHIVSNKYNFHNCGNVRNQQTNLNNCLDFKIEMVIPTEAYALSGLQEFVGAASVADVVHRVYGGNMSYVVPEHGKFYHVLFLEYFNDRNVFMLVGYVLRNLVNKVKISVVTTSKERAAALHNALGRCLTGYESLVTVVVINTLDEYVSIPAVTKFNLIEFNGGLSYVGQPSAVRILSSIKKNLLYTQTGVISATFFSKNFHIASMESLLQRRDPDYHYPFSRNITSLLKLYLSSNKLELFHHDRELLTFLERYYTQESVPLNETAVAPRLSVYTNSDMRSLMQESGLNIAGWLPTAYSHPFDELDHYSVKKFEFTGLSQDLFVFEMFPSFRYSVYVTDRDAEVPGRATLKNSTYIIDRTGHLSTIFEHAVTRAVNNLPITFLASHYASPMINFTYTVIPDIAASATMLSSRQTFEQLSLANIGLKEQILTANGAAVDQVAVSYEAISSALSSFLNYLEKINCIVFYNM
jgi:hypothetical protein